MKPLKLVYIRQVLGSAQHQKSIRCHCLADVSHKLVLGSYDARRSSNCLNKNLSFCRIVSLIPSNDELQHRAKLDPAHRTSLNGLQKPPS